MKRLRGRTTDVVVGERIPNASFAGLEPLRIVERLRGELDRLLGAGDR